jgi:diphthamide synthase subunit DPH2
MNYFVPATGVSVQDILAARAGEQLQVVARDNYGACDLFTRSWEWDNAHHTPGQIGAA